MGRELARVLRDSIDDERIKVSFKVVDLNGTSGVLGPQCLGNALPHRSSDSCSSSH